MWFAILGPLLAHDGEIQAVVPEGRQRVVLAALLLQAGKPVAADTLADLAWDGSPSPGAAVTLRSHVLRLRRALGPRAGARLVTRHPGYLLQAGEDELDVLRFRRLCRDGGAALRNGDWDRADGLLGQALSLWRGAPLADVPCDQLLREEAPGLEEQRLQAEEWQADAALRLGRHGELVPGLQALATRHPLRERFHAQLMIALYRCGRQAEALAAYQHARHILIDEVGTEPGPELRQLHQQVLSAAPALTAPEPAPPPRDAGPSAIPRELPPAAAHFTGRTHELATLTELLDNPGHQRPGTVLISAIGGTAGVGKTALAVHWAHQVAGRFPDGQLYVNLRGYDPDQPVPAADALAGFLSSLGVPGQEIPAGEAERAARYRSLLAGKRMLIVADNAGSAEHVRPLLPASPGSLVIITSRSELTGLAAVDGARLLLLDVLAHEEAIHLLTVRLGSTRATAEPAAIGEIASLCAHLPLALAIASAQAAGRPGVPLAALANELRDTAGRLHMLDAGDPAASVAAVFSWSYRQLSAQAARMFRLLGLHPGPDITIPAAASLAAVQQPEARRLLRELARDCLITEHAAGRYTFHDLLRAYAAEQEHSTSSQADRRTAVYRMLDHYVVAAHQAAMLLDPLRDPLPLPAPAAGVVPSRMASLSEALAWYETEYPVVLAATALAAANGFTRHAWQLPWGMAGFFNRRGHWREWRDAERAALPAVQRCGDKFGEAHVRHGLGDVALLLGHYQEACGHYGTVLRLYEELGDQAGQARAYLFLGMALQSQGSHDESLAHTWRAAELFRAVGHRAGNAEAVTLAGQVLALTGRHGQAMRACAWAARRHHELGSLSWEAVASVSLGYALNAAGRHGAAIARYMRALGISREAGTRRLEGYILTLLAEVQDAAGDPAAAITRTQALTVVRDLIVPDAERVRARLRDPSEPLLLIW